MSDVIKKWNQILIKNQNGETYKKKRYDIYGDSKKILVSDFFIRKHIFDITPVQRNDLSGFHTMGCRDE